MRAWERSPELDADDRRARQLPGAAPDPARVARLRQRVLAAIVRPERRPSRRPTRVVLGVLAVAGAAAAATLWMGGHEHDRARSGPHNAVVEASRGARFSWVTSRPDEVLRLQEGTISLRIAALGPGERFRVLTGDGEVDARGGRLDIAVEQDRLARVEAFQAGVVVRVGEVAPVLLDAGSSWVAPPPKEAAPAAPPTPAPAQEPLPRAHSSPPSHAHEAPARRGQLLPEEPALGEAAFRTGWARLREGAYADAARSFEAACREAKATALAEDACFWRGAALERAGRSQDAERALQSYLAAYPRASRAGEAQAMLGWLLLRAGQRDEAARHFRAAIGDAAAPVRESARRGIQAVDRAP